MAEQSGVPLEVAQELWRLLGFPQAADDDVAFTPADVQALRYSHDLMTLGVLSPERQAALVRTWGRSFARLAEWQVTLLEDVSVAEEVLPRVGALQDYVWRRHLAGAANRLLALDTAGSTLLSVVFVDIVGFTSRSKELTEAELVGWIEGFEARCSDIVVDHGGRIIKNIGDEVLFVTDDVTQAARAALRMTALGADPDDDFPEVRAGLAHGQVVSRLGDVFGPTVNIASRLTSIARPGTVLVDQGAHEQLTTGDDDSGEFRFRHLRRTSVKGYSRLQSWVLRRA